MKWRARSVGVARAFLRGDVVAAADSVGAVRTPDGSFASRVLDISILIAIDGPNERMSQKSRFTWSYMGLKCEGNRVN